MTKAVLIDLDGTLVDTTLALYQAYLKFLKHYGHKGSKKEFKSLIGPSIQEIVETLKQNYKLDSKPEELASMYLAQILHQGFDGAVLFEGAQECIQFAKKNSYKLAIVTSGTPELVKACLEPLGVYSDFDAIITSQDVKNSKPSPDIYQFALEKLGVDAKEAIAIEDSEAGKKAAEGAGIKVFQITHGKGRKKGKEGSLLVKDWHEILKCLKAK